jgi:non-homologous end joining protein Ku
LCPELRSTIANIDDPYYIAPTDKVGAVIRDAIRDKEMVATAIITKPTGS